MTAGNGPWRKAVGRPRGRKHVEARRRMHRLSPGVIGLCFVLILASFAFVVMPSPALASSSMQSSGLSASGTGAGPEIVQGTYLTLQCTHGTISLSGSQYCSHTTVTKDMCDSSSCQFSMTGTVDSGFNFYGWVVSGQASVACGSCLSTTLTLYTPIPGDKYSASVTLDTTPPPTVTITIRTFENWSTSWIPAEVQACPTGGGSCSTASNGGTMALEQYYAYSLSAVDLASQVSFLQWTTDAGSLSSNGTNPTQFTPGLSGTVSLITEIKTAATSWA